MWVHPFPIGAAPPPPGRLTPRRLAPPLPPAPQPTTKPKPHPKKQIIKYDKVIDIPNSMTVLPELLPMAIDMVR